MLYAALTFWLLVIVFTASGVHGIWSGMIKPRVVNGVLLPGTLVAQLGRVLGLLVTGNSVDNTSLMGKDEKGEPTADTPESHKIPVFGAIIVGLLPLLACAGCLYLAARLWGDSVLGQLSDGNSIRVAQTLPRSLDAFWGLLRGGIDTMERMLDAILRSDLPSWPTVLFLYLAVCLTVRMAPFDGNRRGAVGAIVLAGVVIGVLGTLTRSVEEFVASSWPVLSFTVGMLLFLLLLSLVVSGIVSLVRILARNE